MIRVVVTGSECTGKTTLCEALARRFDAVLVPEYVRRFVALKGGPPTYEDVGSIARGQVASEIALTGDSPGLVVLDTDLLSTLVYSLHYYGACPAWVGDRLVERQGDLYLLSEIDVPWVPDGEQRDRGDRRPEMHGLFARAIERYRLPCVTVRGPLEQRLGIAVQAIDVLRSDPKQSPALDAGDPAAS